MTDQEKPERIELSPDDLFQPALDLCRQLLAEDKFDVRVGPYSLALGVEQERTRVLCAERQEVDEVAFGHLIENELDLLLGSLVFVEDDERLFSIARLSSISEEDHERFRQRRRLVAQLFPVERLRREAAAKRGSLNDVLAGVAFQVLPAHMTQQKEHASAAVLVRFSGVETAVETLPPVIGNSAGMSSLRGLLGFGGQEVSYLLTIGDIEYLLKRLDQVRNELCALEEEEESNHGSS